MMSEQTPSPAGSAPVAPMRPEDLPPVAPPSSGYIIQLFLIPALIVAAIVAVWALFGRLADSGSDWKQMVADLESGNEHRRGRAAHGLSQLLRNEEIVPPTDRVPLAEQPEVVDALVRLLSESLDSTSQDPEHIRFQAFLARTAGWLDSDDRTLPVLAKAMQPSASPDVRQSAMMAVAIIAGRHLEALTGYELDSGQAGLAEPLSEPTISDPAVWQELQRAAQDSEPVIRHLAAFAIGNVGGPAAVKELEVMLLDGDPKTRANAAFGLTRNGSLAGIPAIVELMQQATEAWPPAGFTELTAEQQQPLRVFHEIEQPKIVENGIRALEDAWPVLDESTRQSATSVLTSLGQDYHSAAIRSQAAIVLKQLGTHSENP